MNRRITTYLLVALSLTARRAWAGWDCSTQLRRVRHTVVYWHFLAAVWLVLYAALAPYADGTRVYWVQEEPENMGAWSFVRPKLEALLVSLKGTIMALGNPKVGAGGEFKASAQRMPVQHRDHRLAKPRQRVEGPQRLESLFRKASAGRQPPGVAAAALALLANTFCCSRQDSHARLATFDHLQPLRGSALPLSSPELISAMASG